MNKLICGMRMALWAGCWLIAGCSGGLTVSLPEDWDLDASITVPDLVVRPYTVRVEIFNDTDFEVVPRIKFDDDNNFFARLIPAEELDLGALAPGESIQLDMACDKVGLIFSDEAGQFVPDEDDPIAQADETRRLIRGDDYHCGDTILFHFLGNGDDFGVVVSVNSVVVD